MSEEVLHNYLSRAITQTEFLSGPETSTDGVYGTEDDERMLLNDRCQIHRAVRCTQWRHKEGYFIERCLVCGCQSAGSRGCTSSGSRPDFPGGYVRDRFLPGSTTFPSPSGCSEAFGKEPEERNFRFDDIRDEGGLYLGQWGENTCVPDMSREEAQMWFYFMAVKYMEAGIEAFHCGQVRLMASMGDSDNGYAGYRNLLSKIREAAKTKAARGNGYAWTPTWPTAVSWSTAGTLFDFVSFPLRPKEIVGEPIKAKLEKGYLDSVIGYTQGGGDAERLDSRPYPVYPRIR